MSQTNFAIPMTRDNDYIEGCISNYIVKSFINLINSNKYIRADFIRMIPLIIDSDVRNLKINLDGNLESIEKVLNKDVNLDSIAILDKDIFEQMLRHINKNTKGTMEKKINTVKSFLSDEKQYDKYFEGLNKKEQVSSSSSALITIKKIQGGSITDSITTFFEYALLVIIVGFILYYMFNNMINADRLEPLVPEPGINYIEELVRNVRLRSTILGGRDYRRSVYKVVINAGAAPENQQFFVLKVSGNRDLYPDYEHETAVYQRFKAIQRNSGANEHVQQVAKFYGAGYTRIFYNIAGENFLRIQITIEKDGVRYENEPIVIRDPQIQEYYNNGERDFYYLTNEFDIEFRAFRTQYINFRNNNNRLRDWLGNAYRSVTVLLGNLNQNYGFYHGDLHNENVLTNANGTRAKMFDFDFSGFLKPYILPAGRVPLNIMPSPANKFGLYADDRSFTIQQPGVNNRRWELIVPRMLSNFNQNTLDFLFYFDCNRLLQSIYADHTDLNVPNDATLNKTYNDRMFQNMLEVQVSNGSFNRRVDQINLAFRQLEREKINCNEDPVSYLVYTQCVNRHYGVRDINTSVFNTFFASISVNNYIFTQLGYPSIYIP